MSCISLQIGQCGNQFGQSLFSTLYQELKGTSKSDVFFSEGGHARAVLLDMEPKVIEHCLSRRAEWSYRPARAYWKQSGSGNNWSFGFNEYGPLCLDAVVEDLRKEAEICDRLDTMMILKSTAGGTGSGVGSFLSYGVKDFFQKPLISTEMWPFSKGEVCVQSYNTVLSIASSHDSADFMIVFDNDELTRIAKDRQGLSKPSFGIINEVAASHLSHQILGGNLSSTLNHLCYDPRFKIGTVRFVPQTAAKNFACDDWSSLGKTLTRMQHTLTTLDQTIDDSIRTQPRVFTSQVCLRGRGASMASVQWLAQLHHISRTEPLRVISSREPFMGLDKTASMLSVDQSRVTRMRDAARDARRMLYAKAFVHQYERFGISTQCLDDAISNVEDLVAQYFRLN
jgi:tubulin delta